MSRVVLELPKAEEGEDVGGSEVSALNKDRNLRIGSAVGKLNRSVHKCSDRGVAARGFAQSEAGGVGQRLCPGIQTGKQGTSSQGPARPSSRGCSSSPSHRWK